MTYTRGSAPAGPAEKTKGGKNARAEKRKGGESRRGTEPEQHKYSGRQKEEKKSGGKKMTDLDFHLYPFAKKFSRAGLAS